MGLRAIVCVVLLVGCVDPGLVPCGTDRTCLADQKAACAGKALGAACSWSHLPDGLCDPQAICVPKGCGNGVVEAGEACDDGNKVSGDGCNATCTSTEACGNGVVDVGEQCDCGSDAATQPSSCTMPNADTAEAQCLSSCRLPRCGNGVLDPGEVCDDGNNINGDGCNATCTSTGACGNGVLDPGEQCDDGNLADADGCQHNCQLPRCGDGIVDPGEVCDDGNTVGGDGCNANCTSNETCGNGILDPGEQCDDGNLIDHDGCQHTCVLERCGDAILDPGEECDDGNTVDTDACPSTCRRAFCGDGFVWAGVETCDDGNTFGNDLCPRNCRAVCGDGHVDPGEQCDDGNQVDDDGCTNACRRTCVFGNVPTATVRVGGTCYAELGDSPMGNGYRWLDGENECRSYGGHLTSVSSSVEEGYLLRFTNAVQPWLGLSDNGHHGTFAWSDGKSLTYTLWEAGYPHTDQNANCLYLDEAQHKWVTTDCTDQTPDIICKLPACNHNGVVDPGETCDDGNLDDTDACTSWCEPAMCGDGVVHTGFEQCDDGNADDTDACTTACRTNPCGNGVIDPGEQCDHGAGQNYDYGTCPRCHLAFCGDGFVEAGVEECDDGNGNNHDACVGCKVAFCGDGVVETGVEQCDDGNTNPYDGCERCYVATCGNGIKEPGEGCDDGNRIDGDGCPANCSACGNGVIDPGEFCDDGNQLPNDGCPADCKAGCGDGIVESGEQCDDGNANNSDFCTTSCQNPCGYYDYGPGVSLIQGTQGCFAVVTNPDTFNGAIQGCVTLAGSCLFGEPDNNNDISVESQIAAAFGPVWNGVYEPAGSYVWFQTNNGPGTAPWQPGQPDDQGGTRTCVAVDASGAWYDDDCNDTLPYVCLVNP